MTLKIKSTRIKNFRALKEVAIDFDSVTTFIGPNGAGKSTILRGLDWFFNGGRGGELTEKDCSYGAVEEGIEVQVTFSDLTDMDREALGKYAPEGASTFTAWKHWNSDGSESLSANAKSYPRFNEIRSCTGAGDKKSAYNALRSLDSTLGLPAWTNQDAAYETMVAWEMDHITLLVEAPENLQTNFFGFNSNGKMSGLFDFVLVTGDLRASEEAQDAKASIIGRILERSIDRAAADDEIAKIVADSRAAQQKIYSEKFADQLENIKIQLNSVVSTYSPGRTIQVAPSDVELKTPRTTFEVSVFDGSTETAVERQGHGFQRTLLISSLQVLAESVAASTAGVICLAIEEPELFQHPTQAQAFARILRSLTDNPGKRIQVTYATHSPYFIEARHFDQVRRLTRSLVDQPVVTVHAASVDRVKSLLIGVMDPEVVDRQLDTFTVGQLSAALFASKVLLVEGTTESAVFYGIGDRDVTAKLESQGFAVVPANGKGSIALAHAILKSLGIPTYAVFDSDSGFEERAKANGKTQDKIDEERASHSAANRRLLKYFGLDEVDFPSQSVGESVAILEDHLETFLESDWPEWVACCASLEAAAGVSLRKNQLVYRTATSDADGSVPIILNQILSRLEEL